MNLWELPEVNVAYFVSGSGTNFENLERYFRDKIPHVTGKLVISNKSGIPALEKAAALGIPSIILKPDLFQSVEAMENQMISLLRDNSIHLICLAGYLKKLPDSLIANWPNRILNVHPALLPSFGGKGMYGIHVHEAVLNRGCKISGATIHLVTEKYDEGPIVLQDSVPVLQDDTPEILQKRVLTMEYQLYPQAVELLTSKPWTIDNHRFIIQEHHEEN